MKTFRHTANIVHGTPWMIEPQAHALIASILQKHIDGAEIANVRGQTPSQQERDPDGGMLQKVGRSAVVQIHGPILPRANMGNLSSRVTGSAEISEAISIAAASDSESIVLDIDSPGGSVLGGFEAADAIQAASAIKPVFACISGLGCSLAYLLASQADEIIATRASVLGSIGVISSIESGNRAALNEGFDSITVASSRQKAMSGLSEDEIKEQMKANVEMYFGMMKETINRKRKGLVMSAESFPGTMLAPAALEAGLIDDIGTLDELISALNKNR